MMEGSISKYNGLLLLTPSTNPMELFFLGFTMVGAHISSLLSFKFFVTVQSPISIFLPFRMALNRYNFSFHALVSTDEHIIQKMRGVFLSFSGSLYIKK